MISKKTLNKLIKILERSILQKLSEKSIIESLIKSIEKDIDNLAYQIENEKQVASLNPSLIRCFTPYYQESMRKMARFASDITLATHKADVILNELKNLHIDQKKYKLLLEKININFKRSQEKKEIKEVDELNTIKIYHK